MKTKKKITQTPLPKAIIRLDDGMRFVLNSKTGKYRIKMGIPRIDRNTTQEFSYEVLNQYICAGKFKVEDGTEDLEGMRKNWIDSIKPTDGHGNGDFD